jgi:hypothetical protein
MRREYTRAQGLYLVIAVIFPYVRRDIEFVLLRKPVPGPLGVAMEELSFWSDGPKGSRKLAQGLRRSWGKWPANVRQTFTQIAHLSRIWARQRMTLSDVWSQIEQHIDVIIETGTECLNAVLTREALARVNKHIRSDTDLMDRDAIIAEVVLDLKSILTGTYQGPYEERTLENVRTVYKCLAMEEPFGRAKGVQLAERLFGLMASFHDPDNFPSAVKQLAVYLLARRLARDYGHDRESFKSTSEIDIELLEDRTDAFTLSEQRVDLERLIAQADLSPGERVIINLGLKGLEGAALEAAAEAAGISGNSVGKLKVRAEAKLRAAAM